jgi:hypothetical protein
VNFAVVDNGTCVAMDPRGFLIAFKNQPGQQGVLKIPFDEVDMTLSSAGSSLLGFLGSKLYKISM